jgi:hypothetical protein
MKLIIRQIISHANKQSIFILISNCDKTLKKFDKSYQTYYEFICTLFLSRLYAKKSISRPPPPSDAYVINGCYLSRLSVFSNLYLSIDNITSIYIILIYF